MNPVSSNRRGAASSAAVPPGLHRYARALAVMTVLLIWWGAATTTKQAGMAFADWPLSLGSINPPGWLENMVPFLEHSHRLLATVVGLMTLILFAWTHVRRPAQAAELLLLVLSLGITFGLFVAGGAERQDAARKETLFLLGAGSGLLPVAWLAWSWAARSWPLVTRLAGLALLLVTAQAILGGVRVTEVSDTFAVIHGCLAQGFFCLVILIGLATSPRWGGEGRGAAAGAGTLRTARLASSVLVAAIVGQLILGALMRHHHRSGLADLGVLSTGGRWFPGTESEILLLMFAHKYWAVVVFAAAAGLAWWMQARPDLPAGIARQGGSVLALLALQVGLGVAVILTGSPEHKRFWITNFHVLNGLAILAVAFGLCVRCWTAGRPGAPTGAGRAGSSAALPPAGP